MRPGIVAIALALMSGGAYAQEKPAAVTENFQSLAARVASDPLVAGQWVTLLPVIARQCEMAVDNEGLAVVVNRLDSPDAVDEAADYFASRPESRLKADWDVIAKRDQDEACRLADSLWGEAGTLFSGDSARHGHNSQARDLAARGRRRNAVKRERPPDTFGLVARSVWRRCARVASARKRSRTPSAGVIGRSDAAIGADDVDPCRVAGTVERLRHNRKGAMTACRSGEIGRTGPGLRDRIGGPREPVSMITKSAAVSS